MSLSFTSGTHPFAKFVFSMGTFKDLRASALVALILTANYLEPLASGGVSEAAPGLLGMM